MFITGICLTGISDHAIVRIHSLFTPKMSVLNALSLATYVIIETATHDGRIGEPLQLTYLKNNEDIVALDADKIQQIVNENIERSNKMKELFL